jgi:hypothetical protein
MTLMSFGLKIGRSSGVKLFGCFAQAFQNKGLPFPKKQDWRVWSDLMYLANQVLAMEPNILQSLSRQVSLAVKKLKMSRFGCQNAAMELCFH